MTMASPDVRTGFSLRFYLVSFSPWICSFIDTKHFQRLRYIKQLGLSYYVFPGASHNRFEHCLGVGHLARCMATRLREMDSSLGITDQHIKCVELAGLCHDLGHGPWSHVWDGNFIPKARPGKEWKHEQASEMMFDDMVATYQLDITPAEVHFVKALIAGDPRRCSIGQTMPFLFEIVANNRNGLDVDKFDYILRDCHCVGDKGNISITRLINSARVIEGKICYDIKDANQIYELFYTRFSLHKRIYNHKTTKAIEFMVIDALLLAEPHLKIADRLEDPKRYVFLTDDLLNQIEASEDEALEPARAIIERIRTRDLYKSVDYKIFSHVDRKLIENSVTPQAIVDVAKSGVLEGVDEELVAQLAPDHVAVSCSLLHYGKGASNPLESVTFYSKKKPHVCNTADLGDISLLMPSSFAEVWLRIYTKHPDFHGLVQAAYRHILKGLVSAEDSDMPPAAMEAAPEDLEDGFDPEVLAGPAVVAVTVAPTETAGGTDEHDDPDMLAPVKLGTPGPSTPRGIMRNASTGSIASATGERRSRVVGRVSSFSDNQFTAVAPSFRGTSPTRKSKNKRVREGSENLELDGQPSKNIKVDEAAL